MRLSVLLGLLFITCSLFAQPRKAVKATEDAQELAKEYRFEEAMAKLDEALKLAPNYFEANYLKGDILLRSRKNNEAVEAYRLCLDPSNERYSSLLFKLGKTEFQIGEYQSSIQHLEEFAGMTGISASSIATAEEFIRRNKVALDLKSNPVPFNPINMGDSINTELFEYLPALTADGKQFIFGRLVKTYGKENEDFFISEKINDSTWTKAVPLPGFVNSPGNEASQCITADGAAIFFTACDRKNSYGSCDIYISLKESTGWSKAINLGPNVNSSNWDSQPSVSASGLTVYFVSKRSGGYGGSDIWETSYLGAGEWTEARNLGPEINTPQNEMSPFIHWDDQTLYFSSEGHPGLGGDDIFVSKRQMDGSWGTPENLGYPINSYGDQNSMIVGPDGKTAYFASAILEGQGNTDFYSFQLPESKKAIDIAYLKGLVLVDGTNKSIQADVTLIDLETSEVYRTVQSGADGSYFLVLPSNRNFALQVKKDGYLFYSQNFSLKSGVEDMRQFERNIFLQAIKKEVSIDLNNVFFTSGSADLLENSFSELNELVVLLQDYPNMKIEIIGHTDNVGSESTNMILSKDRSKSVKAYLVSKGIETGRIITSGKGETEPKATNETEKGRAMNRRTEIKIKDI